MENTRQQIVNRLIELDIFQDVGGSAQLSLLNRDSFRSPTALVISLKIDSTKNTALSGVMQKLTESYGIFIIIENNDDPRGSDSSDIINYLRTAVLESLLNYQPIGSYCGMTYEGGQLLEPQDNLLIWQDSYNVYTHIQQLNIPS